MKRPICHECGKPIKGVVYICGAHRYHPGCLARVDRRRVRKSAERRIQEEKGDHYNA
jgi:hypothetical protein